MNKRVTTVDMRRMRHRRIAALIARSRRRSKQARSPEQLAFFTLLHRLRNKNRVRPGAAGVAQ